jgi:hypothetical protein
MCVKSARLNSLASGYHSPISTRTSTWAAPLDWRVRSSSSTPAPPGRCRRTRCSPSARDGGRARSAQAPGSAGVSPAAAATRCAGWSEATSGASPTETLTTQPLHPDPRRDAGEPSAGGTPAPPRRCHPRNLGTPATSVGGVRCAGMNAHARSGSPRTLRRCPAARCRRRMGPWGPGNGRELVGLGSPDVNEKTGPSWTRHPWAMRPMPDRTGSSACILGEPPPLLTMWQPIPANSAASPFTSS